MKLIIRISLLLFNNYCIYLKYFIFCGLKVFELGRIYNLLNNVFQSFGFSALKTGPVGLDESSSSTGQYGIQSPMVAG